MSTIDDLIETLMDDLDHAIAGDIPYSEDKYVIETRAAITEPWNAALKAMKAAVVHHDATGRCPQCGHTNGLHRASCFVTPLQAAIAAMEGEPE